MKKVYIVTSGDYSSYRIDGVFSTRKKAKAFITWRGEGRIETRTLDVAPEVLTPLYVRMSQEGRALAVGKNYDSSVGFHCYVGGSLVWGVATTDEGHAIKVVNEKRGQLIAMGVWGNERATKQLLRKEPQIAEAP